jgi:hypothetical protein
MQVTWSSHTGHDEIVWRYEKCTMNFGEKALNLNSKKVGDNILILLREISSVSIVTRLRAG